MNKIVNIQPIEKSESDSGSLSVHSIFYTIQGEGPMCGRPAIFIRLAGCNLQCPSCDTDYTGGRQKMSVETIMRSVETMLALTTRRPLVVITGGEPFRQEISLLCHTLVQERFEVQIETNGTLAPALLVREHVLWKGVTIVCSPKAGKIHPWIERHLTALKYVLSHDSVDPKDGLPVLALNHTASPRVYRAPRQLNKTYLQPMDSKDPDENRKNLEAVKESCMKYGYIFQLQTHKYIGVE